MKKIAAVVAFGFYGIGAMDKEDNLNYTSPSSNGNYSFYKKQLKYAYENGEGKTILLLCRNEHGMDKTLEELAQDGRARAEWADLLLQKFNAEQDAKAKRVQQSCRAKL